MRRHPAEKAMSVDDFNSARNRAIGKPTTAYVLPEIVPNVALWWCSLQRSAEEIRRDSSVLSAEEHVRTERFATEALRSRYIAGRSALRQILGNELGIEPAAVSIIRGARGRPRLRDHPTIDFNVSHTRGVALIGLAHRLRIGVDVERADREVNADALCRKFLAPTEQASLASLDLDARRRRFLRYWTCKEAMSKATGDGLSAPFRRLEVRLGETITLVAGPEPYFPQCWRLHAVAAPADFCATLAIWYEATMRGAT